MRATAIRHPMRLPLLLMVALGAVAIQPSAASAALTWSPCTEAAGFTCSTLAVPLDRDAPSRGTVRLAASRLVASPNPTQTAVVGLAGGPGQAALPLRRAFATVLASAITTRDLLIFDQRGTGQSGLLRCSALREAQTLLQAELGCATELGSARGFYRTIGTVADIEALRIAGGYDKLVLFGVSYGTRVAQAYASTYPSRVEALVLDSVVLPDGLDPFRRSSLAATRRVLRDLCARNACRTASPDVVSDLNAVAQRLRDRRVRGSVITSTGRRTSYAVSQNGLFSLLLAGDLNPTLRAELPGSLRAARRGDWQPLLRLAYRAARVPAGSQSLVQSDSTVTLLATTCEEAAFPWTRAAGPEQRWAEATRAASRLTAAELGPFTARTALESGSAPLCVGWPAAGPPPPAPGPLPQLPTLVLAGQMDLRTPVEDARKIRNAVATARITEVAFAGHSVLTSERSTCSAGAVTAFFAGAPEPTCAVTTNPYQPTARPPASLGAVPATAGYRGTIGRALTLVGATVTDARRQVIGETFQQDAVPQQVGGLRAGVVSPRVSGDSLILTLRRYSYVRGVSVSGQYSTSTGGAMTIRGPGLRGSVQLSPNGAMRGTVNGRRVRVAPAANVARSQTLSVRRLLRLAAG